MFVGLKEGELYSMSKKQTIFVCPTEKCETIRYLEPQILLFIETFVNGHHDLLLKFLDSNGKVVWVPWSCSSIEQLVSYFILV